MSTDTKFKATYEDGTKIKEGDRVRLRGNIERYPHFIVEEGSVGTVEVSPDDINDPFIVKMDEEINDPDNIIMWMYDDLNTLDEDIERIND